MSLYWHCVAKPPLPTRRPLASPKAIEGVQPQSLLLLLPFSLEIDQSRHLATARLDRNIHPSFVFSTLSARGIGDQCVTTLPLSYSVKGNQGEEWRFR